MKFLALAAIYNHGQEWIENLVQSMIDQDYDDSITVIVIDDRVKGFPAGGFHTVSPLGAPRYINILPLPSRADSLLKKYNAGIAYADEFLYGPSYDAVCVIDDDDIYLPDHISQHAKVLQTPGVQWSYPDKVFSTFGHQFRIEASGGRFWASSAYRRTALEGIGNYSHVYKDVRDAAFDQLFLHRMQVAYGEGGHQASPTYVYMWDMTQDDHYSYHIADGLVDYTAIPESPVTGPLTPRYSAEGRAVFEMAKIFKGK